MTNQAERARKRRINSLRRRWSAAGPVSRYPSSTEREKRTNAARVPTNDIAKSTLFNQEKVLLVLVLAATAAAIVFGGGFVPANDAATRQMFFQFSFLAAAMAFVLLIVFVITLALHPRE